MDVVTKNQNQPKSGKAGHTLESVIQFNVETFHEKKQAISYKYSTFSGHTHFSDQTRVRGIFFPSFIFLKGERRSPHPPTMQVNIEVIFKEMIVRFSGFYG